MRFVSTRESSLAVSLSEALTAGLAPDGGLYLPQQWPTALPDLDASDSSVAIQSIQLQHEGWERDLAVVEPTQPSFTIPE